VLGSVVAVAISMWIGIQANLFAAAAIYVGLLVPLLVLRSSAASSMVSMKTRSSAVAVRP
jgi:hypothetical protein